MDKKNLKDRIIELGASLVGFADLRDCLSEKFKIYDKGISIAVKLDDKIIDEIKDGPTIEYSKHYREINKKLDNIALQVKQIIEGAGYKAYVINASKIIDETNLKGEFPHKTAATKAGLGWIGKCALLVTKEYGPRVRLVTVLTNAPLKADTAVTESRCGNCVVCFDNCPAKASKEIKWKPGLKREDIFDVNACHEITKVNKQKVGYRICGICVSRCPWGRKWIN